MSKFSANKESLKKFYLKFKQEINSFTWKEIWSGFVCCPVVEDVKSWLNTFYTASKQENCGDNANKTKSKL